MGAGTKLLCGWDEACSFVLTCLEQGTVSFYSNLRFYWRNLQWSLFKDPNHQWSPEFQVWFLRELEGTGQPVDISTPEAGMWQPLLLSAGHGCLQLQLKREVSEKQHVKDAESSWKSWQSRGRAGNKSPSPGFEDFLSNQDHLCFNGGRLGGHEHKGIRSFKGKSSILCEKVLFFHIRNTWSKRPFSKAWKSFELLHEWQIHLILKAGERQHLIIWPDLPSLTWGQTSDFMTS